MKTVILPIKITPLAKMTRTSGVWSYTCFSICLMTTSCDIRQQHTDLLNGFIFIHYLYWDKKIWHNKNAFSRPRVQTTLFKLEATAEILEKLDLYSVILAPSKAIWCCKNLFQSQLQDHLDRWGTPCHWSVEKKYVNHYLIDIQYMIHIYIYIYSWYHCGSLHQKSIHFIAVQLKLRQNYRNLMKYRN